MLSLQKYAPEFPKTNHKRPLCCGTQLLANGFMDIGVKMRKHHIQAYTFDSQELALAHNRFGENCSIYIFFPPMVMCATVEHTPTKVKFIHVKALISFSPEMKVCTKCVRSLFVRGKAQHNRAQQRRTLMLMLKCICG